MSEMTSFSVCDRRRRPGKQLLLLTSPLDVRAVFGREQLLWSTSAEAIVVWNAAIGCGSRDG